jgi:hypothetical protein
LNECGEVRVTKQVLIAFAIGSLLMRFCVM